MLQGRTRWYIIQRDEVVDGDDRFVPIPVVDNYDNLPQGTVCGVHDFESEAVGLAHTLNSFATNI